jgi:NADPH2:quinone reductase
VREAGVQAVIVYTETDFVEEVRGLTNGRGVDLILDAVGRDTFHKGIAALAPFEHLISYGIAGGAPRFVNVMSLYERSPRISVFVLYTALRDAGLNACGIAAVVSAIRDQRLELRIGGRWPLEQAAEAHRRLRERSTTGKLLLEVRTG